jgi:hypothetical protein
VLDSWRLLRIYRIPFAQPNQVLASTAWMQAGLKQPSYHAAVQQAELPQKRVEGVG